jgi:hypothetical protein
MAISFSPRCVGEVEDAPRSRRSGRVCLDYSTHMSHIRVLICRVDDPYERDDD